MKILITVLAISIFLISGCSSDDALEPQVTIADFEGNWVASSAIFTNHSNPSESVDYIAAGGEIRYFMQTDGSGSTRIWTIWHRFECN